MSKKLGVLVFLGIPVFLVSIVGKYGKEINIEQCESEVRMFEPEEIAIKVSDVQFEYRNSVVSGIDSGKNFKKYYYVMLRPHLKDVIKPDDYYLKNSGSNYYCIVREDSCFLGKFECNTYYYKNTLKKYKLDFKYKFGDDFVIDSTGLHLK